MLPASDVNAPFGIRTATVGMCSNESGIESNRIFIPGTPQIRRRSPQSAAYRLDYATPNLAPRRRGMPEYLITWLVQYKRDCSAVPAGQALDRADELSPRYMGQRIVASMEASG